MARWVKNIKSILSYGLFSSFSLKIGLSSILIHFVWTMELLYVLSSHCMALKNPNLFQTKQSSFITTSVTKIAQWEFSFIFFQTPFLDLLDKCLALHNFLSFLVILGRLEGTTENAETFSGGNYELSRKFGPVPFSTTRQQLCSISVLNKKAYLLNAIQDW